jgi:hypothetical protein
MDVRLTEDSKYRVYVLMRIPRDQAYAATQRVLSQEQELYEKFVRDKVLEQFRKDIEDYKKDLGRPGVPGR